MDLNLSLEADANRAATETQNRVNSPCFCVCMLRDALCPFRSSLHVAKANILLQLKLPLVHPLQEVLPLHIPTETDPVLEMKAETFQLHGLLNVIINHHFVLFYNVLVHLCLENLEFFQTHLTQNTTACTATL